MDLDTPYAFFITRAFTLPEIARTLGISVGQVRKLVNSGVLHAFTVGTGSERRTMRVSEEAVDDYVRDNQVRPVRDGPPPHSPRPNLPDANVKLEPDGFAARRLARKADARSDRS